MSNANNKSTRTLARRYFEPKQGGAGFLLDNKTSYILKVDFVNDKVAPLGVYTGQIGSITVTDSGNDWSVTGSEIRAGSAGTGANDPQWRSTDAIARIPGRTMTVKTKRISTFGADVDRPGLGWSNNVSPGVNSITGILMNQPSATTLNVDDNGNFPGAPSNVSMTYGTYRQFDFILKETGAYLFVDKELFWVSHLSNSASLYPVYFNRSANDRAAEFDYIYVRDLTGRYALTDSLCIVNVPSPTHLTEYVSFADQVIELDVTSPGSLANECGIRYRISGNTYWRAYFDATGAFKLDRVTGGVVDQTHINIASAISTNQTRKIVIHTIGSVNDCYTMSAGVPTKRGVTITQSHQNTSLPIAVDIGATWSVANLKSYAKHSSQYADL